MPGQLFDFESPDRFVAGTVGQPGDRPFSLQATHGPRMVSVSLEKVQVAALAEKLDELLDEVRRRQGADSPVPPTAPTDLEDVAPLNAPIDEEFRAGTLALAWDDDSASVLIEAQSMEDADVAEAAEAAEAEAALIEFTEFTGDLLRVRLTP